jgi:hypothetical protein
MPKKRIHRPAKSATATTASEQRRIDGQWVKPQTDEQFIQRYLRRLFSFARVQSKEHGRGAVLVDRGQPGFAAVYYAPESAHNLPERLNALTQRHVQEYDPLTQMVVIVIGLDDQPSAYMITAEGAGNAA